VSGYAGWTNRRDEASREPRLHRLPRPILQRLRQMRCSNALCTSQIGDCPRELEDTVICSRGELQLAHRRAHQAFARRVEPAMVAHLGRSHLRVRHRLRAGEACRLDRPRRLDARPHLRRRFAEPIVGQLLVFDARHRQLDVDPVEQRAGEALLVADDRARCAGTFFGRIAIEAAGASLHSPIP